MNQFGEIPTKYYNVIPDLPEQIPQPRGNLELFKKIFPREFIKLETSKKRFVTIPKEVRNVLSEIGRPTPLQRAIKLEKKLKTLAQIYFKREDATITGSHKINSAITQIFLGKKEGFQEVVSETADGNWGVAVSMASNLFGLRATINMVRSCYLNNPRKYIMQLYGAKVIPSPSKGTKIGKKSIKEGKNYHGSISMAIAESVEIVRNSDAKFYAIGSLLNSVIMHNTIIGLEIEKQLKEFIDERPDLIVGCVGGGSNFGGTAFPFYRKYKNTIRYIAVESEFCPRLTKGEYKYDFIDSGNFLPQLKMYTLGYNFKPVDCYASGLLFHGMSPIISLLKHHGIIEARAYNQKEAFDAGWLFAKTEGIILAPETCYAIKAVIDEALKAKDRNEKKVIVCTLSGHGLLNLGDYGDVLKLG